MSMLLVLGPAILALAVFFVGEVATLPARQRLSSVRRAATYGRSRATGSRAREPFRDRALTPLAHSLASFVMKLNPRLTPDAVSMKLLAAGLGRQVTPTTFLAAKGGLTLGGVFFGSVAGGTLAGGLAGAFFAFMFGLMGFILPDSVVTMKTRGRRERLRADLPDALDLLAVSVEAGLGFDGAIAKLTEHMDGPLTEEFTLALAGMRIGESRQDALKKMSGRVNTSEMSAFTRAIIQADQLGISLGRILRVQAAETRLRRQAAAEEKAMKAPIKMLFPTVMFIFPAMFLVILGPAFLNLAKVF